MLGGFLAAVWTDLFQSVMMLIGVVVLLILAFGSQNRNVWSATNVAPWNDNRSVAESWTSPSPIALDAVGRTHGNRAEM